MRRTVRSILATLAAAIALVVGLLAGAPPANAQAAPETAAAGSAPVASPDPIVFVHGFGENGARSFFRTSFLRDGVPSDRMFAFDYDAGNDRTPSNKVIATRLGNFIRDTVLPRTGATRVDIVAHSMGSLSSRWCIKFGRCEGLVDDWVSLGGPNHGMLLPLGCFIVHRGDDACPEMIVGSRFLTDLNRGDETPGPVSYTTVRSTSDDVVRVSGTVPLDGATNHTLRGLDHQELTRDPDVYRLVAAAVR